MKFKPYIYLFLTLALFSKTVLSQTAEEYTAKTAFMVKMTHFINWPEYADSRSAENPDNSHNDSIFTICLDGSQKYFRSLENWATSGFIKKKRVMLEYVNNKLSNLGSCNILYITENHNLDDYLQIANQQQFLTISDQPGNAQRGVIVNFSRKNEKLSFEINLEAARNLGFKINPRLLKLATIVKSKDSK